MQSATAASDELFRMGGDEFMGLHQNYTDARRLEWRVSRVFPNVSMGWAMVVERRPATCHARGGRDVVRREGSQEKFRGYRV
ncbi:MAG: hypothetical protein HC933_12920 [Pleurocapsa sp. SU_196_0]|nr:hypothetical protein [Pleurocapsa sp. SU_196_0]